VEPSTGHNQSYASIHFKERHTQQTYWCSNLQDSTPSPNQKHRRCAQATQEPASPGVTPAPGLMLRITSMAHIDRSWYRRMQEMSDPQTYTNSRRAARGNKGVCSHPQTTFPLYMGSSYSNEYTVSWDEHRYTTYTSSNDDKIGGSMTGHQSGDLLCHSSKDSFAQSEHNSSRCCAQRLHTQIKNSKPLQCLHLTQSNTLLGHRQPAQHGRDSSLGQQHDSSRKGSCVCSCRYCFWTSIKPTTGTCHQA